MNRELRKTLRKLQVYTTFEREVGNEEEAGMIVGRVCGMRWIKWFF